MFKATLRTKAELDSDVESVEEDAPAIKIEDLLSELKIHDKGKEGNESDEYEDVEEYDVEDEEEEKK